jgi:hypothetical protein
LGAIQPEAFHSGAGHNRAAVVEPAQVVRPAGCNSLLQADVRVAMRALSVRHNCAVAVAPALNNGWLRAGWLALAVLPACPRALLGYRDSPTDFVVQSAALLGMDNAGCRLNCNLAPTALLA